MSAIPDRSTTGAAEQRSTPVTTAATARSDHQSTENRPHPSRTRQRRSPLTGRALLLGLGIAVAWGLFLWVFIGGSIASFGNPWLYS
jgi:hypothetical protein